MAYMIQFNERYNLKIIENLGLSAKGWRLYTNIELRHDEDTSIATFFFKNWLL
jgi:hypothetical protein